MYKAYLSKEIALEKLRKFCAYQERSHLEVKEKLKLIQCRYSDMDEIIVQLIEDDFLNEERFAKTYARGKFRMKSWGRLKIKAALKVKGISDYCIRKGLSEIDDEDYFSTIYTIINKKRATYTGLNEFESTAKIKQYLFGRGFESELVNKALHHIASS